MGYGLKIKKEFAIIRQHTPKRTKQENYNKVEIRQNVLYLRWPINLIIHLNPIAQPIESLESFPLTQKEKR